MRLSLIHSGDFGYYRPDLLVIEGYGRTHGFGYDNFKVDPRPNVLLLGRWRHPSTRNTLVGGINLNYLDDKEIETLRVSLSDILRSGRPLKTRYWAGKQLVPSIFDKAYRTYDQKLIHAVTPGTLKTWSKKAEKDKAQQQAQQAPAQQQLATHAQLKFPEIPTPEPEVELPPEVAPEPETAQQQRQKARQGAEIKKTQRGTSATRRAQAQPEPPPEPSPEEPGEEDEEV